MIFILRSRIKLVFIQVDLKIICYTVDLSMLEV